MTSKAVFSSLGRLGEVPPPGTDDRRSWLLALTGDELIALTRYHGAGDDAFSECLGWGAYRAGYDDELTEPVTCTRCQKVATFPLWYLTDRGQVARCWNCSAIDHLTTCDRWEKP